MPSSSTCCARAAVIASSLAVLLAMSACGSKPKAPGCKSDKDCTAGKVCAENRCVDCYSNEQCPKGQRCSAHACIAIKCEHDDQCPDGLVCQAGTCKPCTADAECGLGATCAAGVCQRGKRCSKDSDCADDEDCTNGVCFKASAGNSKGSCPLATIYFGFDSSSIEPSERDRLDANSRCITSAKAKNVFLIGHTDSSGTEEYNIALSERRAQAVADYIARLGTDPARLQVVPKGETEPSGLGDDKDRRVEFQWR